MASLASAMTWLEGIGGAAISDEFCGPARLMGIGGGGGMLRGRELLERPLRPWAGLSGSPRPGGRSDRSIATMSGAPRLCTRLRY